MSTAFVLYATVLYRSRGIFSFAFGVALSDVAPVALRRSHLSLSSRSRGVVITH